MAMIHFEKFSMACISAVYTIIIYMFVANFYCTPTEGVKIQYSKYFDGEELVTIYKISLQRCICECNAKKHRCLSLIYKRTFTSCRLNVKKATTLEALEDKPGSIYVEMDGDISGCDNYQMAAKTEEAVFPYNQPACGIPKAKANATIMGNVYSNGSRIKYVCNEGYRQLDQTESVTVCLHNESWSEINFTCKPDTISKFCNGNQDCLEPSSECNNHTCICIRNYAYSPSEYACVLMCREPEERANASIKGNLYSNGSRIQYVCNEGFKQLDQTESVTVCFYNKGWAKINFTCKPDTIGKSCSSSPKCLEPSSECSDGRCVCIQNHSYSLTEYACVVSLHLRCDNYLIYDPRVIPDGHFNASSYYDAERPPCYPWWARLDSNYIDTQDRCGTWASKVLDKSQYIQVNLSKMYSVRAITTQGRRWRQQFVKSYKVLSSTDSVSFQPILDHNSSDDLIFHGNNDSSTSVTNELPCPIEAQYIRINPQEWNEHISLRFDLIGRTLYSADCNFESGTCGWQHENTNLKKWELGRPNNAQEVLPDDHTCSSGRNSSDSVNCSYLYITSDQQEDANAQVILNIKGSNASRCLSLWHTVSANFTGSLNVITVKCEHAIEKLRNTTINNFAQQWSMSKVQVESGVYQIVIEGIWTNTSSGVLAIDDIKLNEQDCRYI